MIAVTLWPANSFIKQFGNSYRRNVSAGTIMTAFSIMEEPFPQVRAP
jgi:hypothetical protein